MDSWRWIVPRAEDIWSRGSDSGSRSGDGHHFHFQENSTSAIINELKFANAKTVRTSFIILASFNVAVAFAMAAVIFWESYTVAWRNNPNRRIRSLKMNFMGPAETYPFILSCGIVVQGISFAAVQSKGLGSLMILGCTIPSQVLLPALFITPYIHLVFGMETTVRALRRRVLAKRGKWNTPISLVVLGLFLLGTLLATIFVRPPNFCFASLLWLLQRYRLECFCLLTVISATLLISGVIIAFRLYTNSVIGVAERIAASHMVYYLAIGIVSNALLIPFFFSLTFHDPRTKGSETLALSMVANVAVNLSGLMNGCLYLFLRSSRRVIIAPKGLISVEPKAPKPGIRIWAPSHFDFSYQITQPIAPPSRHHRTDSKESLIGKTQDEEQTVETPRALNTPTTAEVRQPLNFSRLVTPRLPLRTPESAQLPRSPPVKTHASKGSYSIFPSRDGTTQPKSAYMLPTAAYTPPPTTGPVVATKSTENLLPPPLILGTNHRRDSSIESSGVVPIGLRFSNVDDVPPMSAMFVRDVPRSPGVGGDLETPNPLMPRRPSPLVMNHRPASSCYMDPADDGLPTPPVNSSVSKRHSRRDSTQSGGGVTLSPDVYSPQKRIVSKVVSPKAARLNTPTSRLDSPGGYNSPLGLNSATRIKEQDWI